MPCYTAFGLNIRSDIALATLPPGSSHSDIQIRRGTVTPPPEAAARDTWTTPSDVFLRYQGVGTIQISLGAEIIVDADGLDDRSAGMIVLGPAMGALLHQRGLLVLHASGVIVNGGVVAFLGFSGWGKSTMAAAVVRLGHTAFSDDLVAVSIQTGEPLAYPGYPYLRLGADSGEILGVDPSVAPPVFLGDGRHQVAVPGADPGRALPLARIYVLAESDRPEVELLKPQEAALELIRHSYALPCLRASGLSALHLKSCAELVNHVPICRLSRPRRLELLPEVAGLALEAMRPASPETRP